MGVPALILPISGPYLGDWNGEPFGILNDDGFELQVTIQGQEVNETDQYGMTLVEGIYRGQNWRVRLRGLEWDNEGLLDSLQMFGQTGGSGTFTPELLKNALGNRWSAFCETMLLTAILGNPPSIPQTLTALNAGIAPNSQSAFMMTSKVRELPLEFVLLPYSTTVGSNSLHVPFSTT